MKKLKNSYGCRARQRMGGKNEECENEQMNDGKNG